MLRRFAGRWRLGEALTEGGQQRRGCINARDHEAFPNERQSNGHARSAANVHDVSTRPQAFRPLPHDTAADVRAPCNEISGNGFPAAGWIVSQIEPQLE